MLSLKDKSDYLRGLLVLARMDNEISSYEKSALIVLGKLLGFNPIFCSEAIEELFENSFISENSPKFSYQEIGLAFINDSLKLAFSDQDFHLNEIRWIRNTAKINGIEKDYWLSRMNEYKAAKNISTMNYLFHVERLLNQ